MMNTQKKIGGFDLNIGKRIVDETKEKKLYLIINNYTCLNLYGKLVINGGLYGMD